MKNTRKKLVFSYVVIMVLGLSFGVYMWSGLNKIPNPKDEASVSKTEVLVSTEVPPLQVAATDDNQESVGDKKLRELGFDPKSGHPITMVVKSNTTNKTSQ